MLEALKQQVCLANMGLVENKLVTFTWGNASGIDRAAGLVVIKPSGVAYTELSPEKMVVLNLRGEVVEGTLSPSSDAPTHCLLYSRFPEIGGVVHTHSHYATVFAQAGLSLPPLGTTHADTFYGPVPCTRALIKAEIEGAYELETGNVIVEAFQALSPAQIPGVLVKGHGPFAWGGSPADALYHAAVLEEVARMAFHTLLLKGGIPPLEPALLDKHFLRKHGEHAYYGQKEETKG